MSSFSTLTIDIDQVGSPADRATTSINTQTKIDNNINSVVNGDAPVLQTGGAKLYNKIYDIPNKKYISINSKKGKQLINNYLDKLKYN